MSIFGIIGAVESEFSEYLCYILPSGFYGWFWKNVSGYSTIGGTYIPNTSF